MDGYDKYAGEESETGQSVRPAALSVAGGNVSDLCESWRLLLSVAHFVVSVYRHYHRCCCCCCFVDMCVKFHMLELVDKYDSIFKEVSE